jgi:hypothetical protein
VVTNEWAFLDLEWALAHCISFVGMSIEISSDLIENLPLVVLVASGVYSVD